MVVDVGGGSTEFILGSGGEPSIQHSFPVGVVRLHEAGQWGDPPSPAEAANCRAEVRRFLTSEVAPKFRDVQMGAGADRCRLVGVGGSATVMAAMELQLEKFDRVRIEGIELSRAMVDAWERRLWGMSHDARCNVRGLPPARADVILAGVSIYSAILETFGFDRVTVTTRGLRYALMEEMT